ncbi:MAG: hypothetical protein U5J98_07000 [Halobacteriales archaeon]|nr:hypothetical protein [Halobacteriales archaeon]
MATSEGKHASGETTAQNGDGTVTAPIAKDVREELGIDGGDGCWFEKHPDEDYARLYRSDDPRARSRRLSCFYARRSRLRSNVQHGR